MLATGSSQPRAAERQGHGQDLGLSHAVRHIAVVDDDELFRESITQNLRDQGFSVVEFGDGQAFLDYLAEDARIDVLLLDWQMPRMNGIVVLSHVRAVSPDLPVIFLTVLSDQIYEEAALLGGAVDFVEKSRSFSIVLHRIRLVPRMRTGIETREEADRERVLTLDRLTLDLDSSRCYWDGQQVNLTLSEFSIVNLLASKAGADVPYRRIYDVVHGRDFFAGCGEDGYRANVRSLIKRIRQKFRAMDDSFDCIDNYAGFGYRWRPAA